MMTTRWYLLLTTYCLLQVRYDDGPVALGNISGAQWAVEEERVSFWDVVTPGIWDWRPWQTSDLYRADLHGKRVLVSGSTSVADSTLPRPGGGDSVCTLLGHSRCRACLGSRRWQVRAVDTPISDPLPLSTYCSTFSHQHTTPTTYS